MGWSIEGGAKNIKMGVSQSGAPYVFGDGVHKPQFSLDRHMPEQLASITVAECRWSFYPSGRRFNNHVLDQGSYEVIRREPQKTHTFIGFFADTSHIGFTFVLPQDSFTDVFVLLRTVLLSEQLKFGIFVDLAGFDVANGPGKPVPDARGFLSGRKCYLGDSMSLVIEHQIREA
jgi:hypothetical protein